MADRDPVAPLTLYPQADEARNVLATVEGHGPVVSLRPLNWQGLNLSDRWRGTRLQDAQIKIDKLRGRPIPIVESRSIPAGLAETKIDQRAVI